MILWNINLDFSKLSSCRGQVAYALLTHSPVATKIASYLCAAPRLACVKPAASVHPEPGSNSSLYKDVEFMCVSFVFLRCFLISQSFKELYCCIALNQ